MSDRLRKVKEEMLVTHLPSEKDKAGRMDRGGPEQPGGVVMDRDSLRRELAQATTEEQRRFIIESIRERFGNDVAGQIVQDVREARSPGEAEGEKG